MFKMEDILTDNITESSFELARKYRSPFSLHHCSISICYKYSLSVCLFHIYRDCRRESLQSGYPVEPHVISYQKIAVPTRSNEPIATLRISGDPSLRHTYYVQSIEGSEMFG